MPKLILFALLIATTLSATTPARAAFPAPTIQCTSSVTTNAEIESMGATSVNAVHPHEEHQNSHKKNKSQATAALLAFFLGIAGAHRFYLGYTWQGILQAMRTPIMVTGIILSSGAILFGPAAIAVPLLLFGGVVAIYIWCFVDFIRILAGSLEPANGEYE